MSSHRFHAAKKTNRPHRQEPRRRRTLRRPVSVLKGSLHLSILSLLLPISASAGSADWNNPGTSSWTNVLNWNGGILPTATDYARIGNGGTAVLGSGTTGLAEGVFAGADSGTGFLQISGGSLTSNFGIIGHEAAGVGTVSITSGTWQNAGNISVGYKGSGTMNFSGGQVNSNEITVGEAVGATGTLTMTGGILQLTDNLSVGDSGKGTLNFSGGSVTAPLTNIGEQASANGTITLSGSSGNRGILTTGQVRKGSGTGALTFSGGVLRASGNQSSFISGFSAGALQIQSGGAFIDSNSFSVTITTPLQGDGGLTKLGTGTLTLSGAHAYTGGTTVETGTLTITNNTTFNSAVTVNSGATLTLNIASDVKLLKGISGAGSVNVAGSGTTARLGGDNSGLTGSFTLPLNSRGMMWSSATAGSALAKWELSGVFAVIETGDGNSTVKLGELSGTKATTELSAFGGSGLKTFEVGALGTNSTFAGIIQDAHTGTATVALTKVGTGALTLSATNTYTGGTIVTSGKLLVSGSITGTTTIQSSGTLGGTGSVLGNTTVAGTVAPGIGVGLLTFGNDLTLQAGSVTAIELGGLALANFDRVSVDKVLTYGGTLSLSPINGFAPKVGDTFQLFQDFDSQSGAFASIAFSDPGVVGSFNYSTGTLSIVAIPEPSAGMLVAAALLGIFTTRRRCRK